MLWRLTGQLFLVLVKYFLPGVVAADRPQKLSDIIDILKKAYCQGIGVEFMHIADLGKK